MKIIRAIPSDHANISRNTNFLVEIESPLNVFSAVLEGIAPAHLLANNIFSPVCRGPYSIIRNVGTNRYIIIFDLMFTLVGGITYSLTISDLFEQVTLEFTTSTVGDSDSSSLRQIVYTFKPTGDERLDNIPGFKFDETYFASDKYINDYIGMTSLWDARSDDIDDGAFKSGIGYNDDIEPDSKLTNMEYSIGSFEKWSLAINHGTYYISKYYNYLFSKDAIAITPLLGATNPWPHTEVALTKTPKSNIPIMIATYSRIVGNYIPSLVTQKYQFSASNINHNTFCCKYCSGTSCTYADEHPFDSSRYLSDTMGQDYSSYYDNSLFGRCDNTACPGHTLDNLENNIMWGNVSTDENEFVYVRDTNKVICNSLLLNESHDPVLFGYTNGAKYQWIDVDHRSIVENSVKVYIGGTPITAGFDVDLIGGRIQLAHDEIDPTSLRNTYGYTIQVEYDNEYELIYEPSDAVDFYIPTDLNLNPLYSGITRGFVSMINSPLDPDIIGITTTKESLGYNIVDPISGNVVPVYGPLYIGNDYAYITAKVTEKSAKYGVPNIPVTYRYYDYGTSGITTNKYKTTYTNSEGNTLDAYAAPPDSDLQLVYIKLTNNNDDFGTTTMFAGVQDTIVLPYTIPRQCIVTENGNILVDIFAVYKDDPVLGVENADEGEVEWEETGDGASYKTNGRKEILYKWVWDNEYLQDHGQYVPVTPTELGGELYLFDEDDNLVTDQVGMVKKIVYAGTDGVNITSSLLPHNTNDAVGAYCMTIPRYIIAHAEMEIRGFDGANEYYTKASNYVAFEVKLPDYMRGVFKVADIGAQDAKSLDGATYLSVDPMTVWDLARDKFDPRALGHTILIKGMATLLGSISGIPCGLFSLRQSIHVMGEMVSNLRHIIAARPVNRSQLRQLIYAGNVTYSKLRHVIQAVKESQVGFDFTLNVVDPPSDGFDTEFNLYKAKEGGVSSSGEGGGSDPTNPINIEFTPSGAIQIVSPSSQDWNRYGGSFSGESSGMTGDSSSGPEIECPLNMAPYRTGGNYGTISFTISNIPRMEGSKSEAIRLNKKLLWEAYDPMKLPNIREYYRYRCYAPDGGLDGGGDCEFTPDNDDFYESHKPEVGLDGGAECYDDWNILDCYPLGIVDGTNSVDFTVSWVGSGIHMYDGICTEALPYNVNIRNDTTGAEYDLTVPVSLHITNVGLGSDIENEGATLTITFQDINEPPP